MRIITHRGYLFTANFFVKVDQTTKQKIKQEVFSNTVLYKGELIEMHRASVFYGADGETDRAIGLVPNLGQPEPTLDEVEQMDADDLIIIDYTYFKLVVCELPFDHLKLKFYLNLLNGNVCLKYEDTIVAGIKALENPRLKQMMDEARGVK